MSAEEVKVAWYARNRALIVAAVAALLGLILLVVGVTSLTGASSTRDEADRVDAQASVVQQDARDISDLAAGFPDLAKKLDRKMDDLTDAKRTEIAAFNALNACVGTAAATPGNREGIQACFDTVDAVEAALEKLTQVIADLKNTTTEAEKAVKEARRG